MKSIQQEDGTASMQKYPSMTNCKLHVSSHKFCNSIKRITISWYKKTDMIHRQKDKFTIPQAWGYHNRYITIQTEVLMIGLGQKDKSSIILDTILMTWNINISIPKPILRPEYEALFEYHSYLIQGLHRIYLFVALKLLKEYNLILDPPSPWDCYSWGRHKISHYMVNKTH